jgi:hypothetical protein
MQVESTSLHLTPPIEEQTIGQPTSFHDVASPVLNIKDEETLTAAEIEADLTLIPNVAGLEDDPLTLAQQIEVIEELTEEVPAPAPRTHRWVGAIAIFLLVLTLIAQIAYFFRVEIAAHLPGLKPLLIQYCELLECKVDLPQISTLMSIESSELESDRVQSNLVTLHALLHNRAPYAQAYPILELTLTDMQDATIARRIFQPKDYLKVGTGIVNGLSANNELSLAIRMDTTDLKPSGYRLFLFYPR